MTLFLMLASHGLQGQTWSPTGGNTISTTGTVGVGTTVPDGQIETTTCIPDQNGIIATKVDCSNPSTTNGGSGGVGDWSISPGGGPGTVVVLSSPGAFPYIMSNSIDLNITVSDVMAHHLGNNTGLGNAALFWGRTQTSITNNTNTISQKTATRFIVLPNGYTGINNATPRVELDVIKTGYSGPVAIFGVRAVGANPPTLVTGEGRPAPPAGTQMVRTQQLSVVPLLMVGNYNKICQTGDLGLIFTDGKGQGGGTGGDLEGHNTNAGLVIAPFAATTGRSGGIRIAANGDIDLAGEVKALKITVNTKWWPDFVFQPNYQLMPLEQVSEYIAKNHHLPGFKADTTMISEGNDIGETQALQQQKIEELTLYTIQQNALLKQQAEAIEAQATAIAAQSKKQAELETLVQQLLNK